MFDKSALQFTRFKMRPLLSGIIVTVALILIQWITNFWLRAMGVTLIAMGLFLLIQKLAIERQKLLGIIAIDELTAIGNYKAYQERLRLETKRAQRRHDPLTLILIDLDQFKKYNDLYGHRSGNELLYSAGQVFKNAIRSIDGVYRFGGDEFAIILPETELEEALHVVKRIRQSFESLPNRATVTLSMGVASYRDEPTHDFFDRVDHLLYDVKSNGGNGCQSDLSGSKTSKGPYRTAL